MKEVEKLLPDLKLKFGLGTSFIYEVNDSGRITKGSIFSAMSRLADASIESWSMYHCSLDDVFFQIVKKYSPQQVTPAVAN
jgi:hypothetical protein